MRVFVGTIGVKAQPEDIVHILGVLGRNLQAEQTPVGEAAQRVIILSYDSFKFKVTCLTSYDIM